MGQPSSRMRMRPASNHPVMGEARRTTAERKGNLTYLSWAWAWQIVKSHYPRCCRWKNNNASGSEIG